MNSERVPPDVRAAISTFLNERPRSGEPFAMSDALDAVRRIFPALEISDSALADAITSEATTAGAAIDYDIDRRRNAHSIDRWDNEGGAPAGRGHPR
jgi:hypothetical protein